MPGYRDVVDEARKVGAPFTPGKFSLALIVVASFAFILLAGSLFETNNAGYYSVKQSAGTGTLKAFTSPGMFVQMFGEVTKYRQADVVHFSGDKAIEVRFNDGAQAKVPVNVRYELPSNPEKLVDIHQKFRNQDALVQETIMQVISEAVRLSAALMSTEESYTTKKAEFSQLALDQATKGIYQTEAKDEPVKDPKTGEIIHRQTVVIQKDSKGLELRKAPPLEQYGIKITQFVIGDTDYDDKVDAMIATKQEAMQKTVSAKANAEKAVQDRLTAEEEGRKNVAIAKYEQEVSKQKAVTQAEQELEVAKLRRAAAEMEKASLIAKGEGEGTYKRLVMQADGALTQKLAAAIEINKVWADASAKTQHPLTPSIVMGGGASTSGNAMQQMMELVSLKAARDLSVDIKAGK